MKKIIIFITMLAISTSLVACGTKPQEKQEVINNKNVQKTTSEETKKDNQKKDPFAYNEENQILKIIGQDENAWNIYQSKKYNFEIKMPEYFEKDISNSNMHNDLDWFVNTRLPNTWGKDLFVKVMINDKKIKKVSSREEFINLFKDGKDSPGYGDFRNMKINNYEVFKIAGVGGIRDVFVDYYIITKQRLFVFSYDVDPEKSDIENYKKEKEDSVMSIIKTFRLLD